MANFEDNSNNEDITFETNNNANDWSDDEQEDYEIVNEDATSSSLAETGASLPLEFRGQRTSNLSNVLASTAASLDHQLTANKLSHALHERRSSGLQTMHDNLSSVLAAPAVELEKNLKVGAVSRQLGRRSSQQDLIDRGVLLSKPTSMSNVLVGTAKELEKNMRIDNLHTGLSVAQRKHEYLQAAGGEPPAEQPLTVKQRMEQYKSAAQNSAAKNHVSPQKENDATATASPAQGGGLSLKERLLAYTTQANTTTIKKQVDVSMEMAGREQKETEAA